MFNIFVLEKNIVYINLSCINLKMIPKLCKQIPKGSSKYLFTIIKGTLILFNNLL